MAWVFLEALGKPNQTYKRFLICPIFYFQRRKSANRARTSFLKLAIWFTRLEAPFTRASVWKTSIRCTSPSLATR